MARWWGVLEDGEGIWCVTVEVGDDDEKDHIFIGRGCGCGGL